MVKKRLTHFLPRDIIVLLTAISLWNGVIQMTIEEMKKKKNELGYTNDMVSALSGVPLGTVQKVFAGETKSPRYDTIQKLEKVLSAAPYERRNNSSLSSKLGRTKLVGIADGKYEVPDDIDLCNSEIAKLFDSEDE